MKTVLSTRTLSPELIALGLTLNLDIQCEDFIEVTEIPFNDAILMKSDFDSVAFTSSYAVKALIKNEAHKEVLKSKNIFAISGRTEDVLLKAGIKVTANANDADALADKIVESKLTKSLLHPGGNLTLNRLSDEMNAANIDYRSLMVYHTELINIKLEKEYDAVMFYSPSGVESFFHSNKLTPKAVACCIGETTANALKEKYQHGSIITSANPSVESMPETIANYFKQRTAEA